MKALDAKLLKRFLSKAGAKLKGEWLLLGGTLLPAVGLETRTTVDIDLVGLGKVEAAQALELMELAESLELPVETINQAAAFFLNKVGYQKSDLIPLHKGKTAIIFRPSVELYWTLKMGRLTESDLSDCQYYLKFCQRKNDSIDSNRLAKSVQTALKATPQPEKRNRLKVLASLIPA